MSHRWNTLPEVLARRLQDTLFFAYEALYFCFAKLRQRLDG
jgi:hypothetical protein